MGRFVMPAWWAIMGTWLIFAIIFGPLVVAVWASLIVIAIILGVIIGWREHDDF